MRELKLSVDEYAKLIKAFRETLGISSWIATIMVCRATDNLSDSDVAKYGTNFEESFNQLTLDRAESK